jgi:hypothetical protein
MNNEAIKYNRDEFIKIIHQLFMKAFEVNQFDALCSLLRVGGMADANWDPFEESRTAFDDYNWAIEKARKERHPNSAIRFALLMYCQAIEMTAPHEIMANMLGCIQGSKYVVNPFEKYIKRRKKVLFSDIPPSAKVKFRHIKDLCEKAKNMDLPKAIDTFFDEGIRNAFSHSDYILTGSNFRTREGGLAKQRPIEELIEKLDRCFDFYGAFIYLHRRWLKELNRTKTYHKWPNYLILEILKDDEIGVYGFNVHFSNGSKATYTRRLSGSEQVNIGFEKDGSLKFIAGDLDELEPKWKINGKVVEDFDSLP